MEKILIIDYGSQYTQLISRRLRELNVYTEIMSWDHAPEDFVKFAPKGVVLSGGPAGVGDEDAPTLAPEILKLNVPILGICYGMQLLAKNSGGVVVAGNSREYGFAKVRLRGHSPLFINIEDEKTPEGFGLINVWMSHGDHVDSLPDGYKLLASTKDVPICGFFNEAKKIYALQFHPEVHHTTSGAKILKNFAFNICNCSGDWQMSDFINTTITDIKNKVGTEHVILGLSGGVDSAVAAGLIHKALANDNIKNEQQLHCVFVDHGLLRLGEAEEVMQVFANDFKIDVELVDAKKEFYSALAGVIDPEKKRKIIGAKFIEVFDAAAKRKAEKTANSFNAAVKWLAQGTIYPDVVESAGANTKKAHNIKSHHNVGGLPEKLNLKLLEPLRDLFKDEVRKTGLLLGLPESLINRHPFPGPGLAVRILGEITAEKVQMLQLADDIFIKALRKEGWYDKTSQAFAVFLPVQSVGVMGDGRTYQNCIALRAVQTEDFMTAHHAPIPHELLGTVAQEIVNKVRGINRVVYDITSKPPATIEWE